MLNINPELVCGIILRVREFQAKEGVTMPEDAPNPSDDYDWSQVLADHSDDLTYQELRETISDLEPDQQYELIGLILVGRGDYDVDDFAAATEAAQDIEVDHIPQFILSLPLAANYLLEGLQQLGYKCDI